jgi:hypothetical protein
MNKKYLINLARFVSYNEKKEIFKELKQKGYEVENDSWSYRRLIINKPMKPKPFAASIIELKETFFPKTISETVEKLKKYKIKEIKAKIGREVPFHGKAITDRYLKKNKYNDSGDIIYLEANMINEKPCVRIGIYQNTNKTKTITKINNYPDIAIESPFTFGEIADFVRLSKIFKIKVYIATNKDKDCIEAISNFKRDSSFDKGNIEVIDYIFELKEKYEFIGFSMWGNKSIQEIINSKRNKLLIFGNERRGLMKSTMDSCTSLIKIANASEPLRSTQAAAFAFGYINSKI